MQTPEDLRIVNHRKITEFEDEMASDAEMVLEKLISPAILNEVRKAGEKGDMIYEATITLHGTNSNHGGGYKDDNNEITIVNLGDVEGRSPERLTKVGEVVVNQLKALGFEIPLLHTGSMKIKWPDK
jgi:hypothetical protein